MIVPGVSGGRWVFKSSSGCANLSFSAAELGQCPLSAAVVSVCPVTLLGVEFRDPFFPSPWVPFTLIYAKFWSTQIQLLAP